MAEENKEQKQCTIQNVSECFYEQIEKRITQLQSDWNYYTKPRRISCDFSTQAHEYYKSIPIRLLELEWIVKNVH